MSGATPSVANLSALQERFARSADDEPSLCAIVAFLPGGPRKDDADPIELQRRLFAGERCCEIKGYKEVMECLKEPVWTGRCQSDEPDWRDPPDWWDCRLYMHRRRESSREPDRFLSLAEEASRMFGLGGYPTRWLVHLAREQTWDTPGMNRMSRPATPDRWHVWIQNVSSVSAWVVGTHIPAADPVVLARETPTIWYHGLRGYSTDGVTPLSVTPHEHAILTVFLKHPTALDTETLENKSGVTNVSRVVGELISKYDKAFAPSVRAPGRDKGAGYFIRVRQVEPA